MPFYDNMMDMPEYFAEKKGYTFEIVEMSPDDYLYEVAWGFSKDKEEKASPKELRRRFEHERISKELIEKYTDRWKKGEKPPMLTIEYRKTKYGDIFFAQEGIHRAVMAKRLGVKKVPVMRVFYNISREKVRRKYPMPGKRVKKGYGLE